MLSIQYLVIYMKEIYKEQQSNGLASFIRDFYLKKKKRKEKKKKLNRKNVENEEKSRTTTLFIWRKSNKIEECKWCSLLFYAIAYSMASMALKIIIIVWLKYQILRILSEVFQYFRLFVHSTFSMLRKSN